MRLLTWNLLLGVFAITLLSGCEAYVHTDAPAPARVDVNVKRPEPAVDIDVNRGPGGVDVEVKKNP
jgi:hypothetical protein